MPNERAKAEVPSPVISLAKESHLSHGCVNFYRHLWTMECLGLPMSSCQVPVKRRALSDSEKYSEHTVTEVSHSMKHSI